MLARLIYQNMGLIRSYFSTLGGSAGRLVISLLYFVSLANALSIGDFGLFAAASAVGVVLSRLVSFGFVSPLYRTATVRPRLIGTYYAGFLLASLLSLPLVALAAWVIFAQFFEGQLPSAAFALIMIAETLLWRSVEVIVIVNNGLRRFGRASMMVVSGTIFRALAAAGFAYFFEHTIMNWAIFYFAANLAAAAVAAMFFLPQRRLRLRPEIYLRHLRDSFWTAGAEILFYIQMELDKLVVLAFGGAELSGLYAIVMRLADLTAIPVRSFNMLFVQRLMRARHVLPSLFQRAGIETLIFAVSVAGFAVMASVLWVYPNILGKNVAIIAGVLAYALLVPGFRNLVEYHSELLYARGQSGVRMINLGLLAAGKILLLALVLAAAPSTRVWLTQLNYVFAALWLGSALLTYSAMRGANGKN